MFFECLKYDFSQRIIFTFLMYPAKYAERRICWKHENLIDNNFLEKFLNKYSWKRHLTNSFDSCFNDWVTYT